MEQEKFMITNSNALSLSKAIKEFSKNPLPPKLAYLLYQLAKSVDPISYDLEQKRLDLIKNKYGEVKKDGDKNSISDYTIPQEKVDDFLNEYKNILTEKIEIESVRINKEEIFDLKVDLTIEFISSLEPFIK